jgi:hypothetical protein
MVVRGDAVEPKPRAAAQQLAGGVGGQTSYAARGVTGQTRRTTPASRNEREHDAIAGAQLVDAGADFFDDPCRFMSEHQRERLAQRAVDVREIGVAEPGRRDAHEHFSGLRRQQLELDDLERPASRVGPIDRCIAQHRSPRLHHRRVRPSCRTESSYHDANRHSRDAPPIGTAPDRVIGRRTG